MFHFLPLRYETHLLWSLFLGAGQRWMQVTGPGPTQSLATESKFQVHQITSGDQTSEIDPVILMLMIPLIAGAAPDEARAGQMTRVRSAAWVWPRPATTGTGTGTAGASLRAGAARPGNITGAGRGQAATNWWRLTSSGGRCRLGSISEASPGWVRPQCGGQDMSTPGPRPRASWSTRSGGTSGGRGQGRGHPARRGPGFPRNWWSTSSSGWWSPRRASTPRRSPTSMSRPRSPWKWDMAATDGGRDTARASLQMPGGNCKPQHFCNDVSLLNNFYFLAGLLATIVAPRRLHSTIRATMVTRLTNLNL